MSLREMECGKCDHWTKTYKSGETRLCRHPNHLRNSKEDKEHGQEHIEFTGPHCYCEDFHREGYVQVETPQAGDQDIVECSLVEEAAEDDH